MVVPSSGTHQRMLRSPVGLTTFTSIRRGLGSGTLAPRPTMILQRSSSGQSGPRERARERERDGGVDAGYIYMMGGSSIYNPNPVTAVVTVLAHPCPVLCNVVLNTHVFNTHQHTRRKKKKTSYKTHTHTSELNLERESFDVPGTFDGF